MADDRADFEALVSPIYDYLNHTTTRMAFVDSYYTDNLGSDGMHARPVIGGVFIKMLADPAVWKSWASRDTARIDHWAATPVMPTIKPIVQTSLNAPAEWRFSFKKPSGDWTASDFDDRGWRTGPGGFGTQETPGAAVRTTWDTSDIWLRREITLPAQFDPASLHFLVYHDEDVEIYLDGTLAAKEQGYVNTYEPLEIRPAARAALKGGQKVVLAVHCHQTKGGQGVDVGLAELVEPTK
jgi:hypothetical protein